MYVVVLFAARIHSVTKNKKKQKQKSHKHMMKYVKKRCEVSIYVHPYKHYYMTDYIWTGVINHEPKP